SVMTMQKHQRVRFTASRTKGEEQPFRCRSNGTAGVLFRQQAPLDPMRPMLAPALRSGWGQARTTACHGLQSTHCKYSVNTPSNLFRRSADEATTLPLNSWPCSDMKSTMNKAT